MSPQRDGLAHSVQVRLVRHAKAIGVDPNLVITRFGVERFLYRLSRSRHAERFVLKGALLLLAWLGETLRPTRDADLLGVRNSRMKDYFDVRALLREGRLDEALLARAIAATFERRRTALPEAVPVGLSDAFSGDAGRQAQWRAFLAKNRLQGPTLPEVVYELRARLATVLDRARGQKVIG